jgi:hypothetical protein
VRRSLLVVLALFLAVDTAVIGFLLLRSQKEKKPEVDPPALVVKMREVAELETLRASLYKKVSFAPDPVEKDNVWGSLVEWAKHSVNPPKGKAIIFADVWLGLDLKKIEVGSMRLSGTEIDVVLPPLTAKVELKPAETEVIGSNLDTAQSAELFEKAKLAFEHEALADPELNQRARASAERSIRALLLTAGFRQVRFVEKLPEPTNAVSN